MGEKAVFSTMAHTFQIDPETKRKWLPTSSAAVRVSYYHDPGRKTYRIIAIENTKALINSTITANMTFTKTSPKFGQWSDHRANTVFGLGFGSEKDLAQFSERFQEAKAAAKALLEERKRMKKKEIELPPAGNQAAASPSNGGSSGAMRSTASPTLLKSEEDEADKESEREKEQDLFHKKHDGKRSTLDHHADAGSAYSNSVSAATASSSAANGTVQPEEVDGAMKQFITSSSNESQLETLKLENSKLKVALASSAQNVKKWETEMQTLRNNNAMLTTALEESTQHVSEWKRQLQKYKEECDTWKKRVEQLEQEKSTMLTQEDMVEITKENEELKDVLSAVQLDLERETTEHFAKTKECSALSEKLKSVEEENQRLKREQEELLRQQAAAKLATDQKISLARDRHREVNEKLGELLALHQAASTSLEL